jgi:hypothetical protein
VSYSVGQVAGLAGVTIRTLHHYDEIGLLSPSGRSAAGYRSKALEAVTDQDTKGFFAHCGYRQREQQL